VTEATQALVEAVRAFLAEDPYVTGASTQDMRDALDELDSEVCSAEMDHHHGKLTCTRRPGHPERRHRDYLRGEWVEPEAPGPHSLTERLNR
jgi:hypothetical protein